MADDVWWIRTLPAALSLFPCKVPPTVAHKRSADGVSASEQVKHHGPAQIDENYHHTSDRLNSLAPAVRAAKLTCRVGVTFVACCNPVGPPRRSLYESSAERHWGHTGRPLPGMNLATDGEGRHQNVRHRQHPRNTGWPFHCWSCSFE